MGSPRPGKAVPVMHINVDSRAETETVRERYLLLDQDQPEECSHPARCESDRLPAGIALVRPRRRLAPGRRDA